MDCLPSTALWTIHHVHRGWTMDNGWLETRLGGLFAHQWTKFFHGANETRFIQKSSTEILNSTLTINRMEHFCWFLYPLIYLYFYVQFPIFYCYFKKYDHFPCICNPTLWGITTLHKLDEIKKFKKHIILILNINSIKWYKIKISTEFDAFGRCKTRYFLRPNFVFRPIFYVVAARNNLTVKLHPYEFSLYYALKICQMNNKK